jgi:hypothetical protein
MWNPGSLQKMNRKGLNLLEGFGGSRSKGRSRSSGDEAVEFVMATRLQNVKKYTKKHILWGKSNT